MFSYKMIIIMNNNNSNNNDAVTGVEWIKFSLVQLLHEIQYLNKFRVFSGLMS